MIKLVAAVLTIFQFILIALLIVLSDFSQPSIFSFLIFLITVCLSVWILIHNRPGNFNIVPMVKKSAELVNSGPYKYVRHPMYSLILISSIVCLIESTTIGLSVLCYLLLFLDLFFKARIEENFLRKHFPNYAEMMTAKKRFFPLLI